MPYTGTEIFDRSIAIIDELSDSGAVSDAQIAEYKYRAPYLLDLWQKEMARTGGLFKTFEISCFRKKNLLTDVNQFQAVEHTDTDQTYEGTGANCFFFGVDGPATVSIEELTGAVWTAVTGTYIKDNGTPTAFTGTIAADTATSSFSYYKGIISPTNSANSIRLRFSGTYYYRHTNRALCPYKYQAAADVQDFMPWCKITMPTDFKSKSQIIDEYPNWQYSEVTNHRWEGSNELYVLFSYEGIIRIKYIPVPTKITVLTQTLEVDDITATSGAYYIAEHFAMADQNDALAKKCRDKFKELKIEGMVKTPLAPSDIKDIYGISDIK
jgi:hypothetical protein